MKYLDWDRRPAVLGSTQAFAMLDPGAKWTEVDYHDVRQTAGVLTEAQWHHTFEQFYGYPKLTPPTLS